MTFLYPEMTSSEASAIWAQRLPFATAPQYLSPFSKLVKGNGAPHANLPAELNAAPIMLAHTAERT